MAPEEHPLLRSIVSWAAFRSDVRAVHLTASRSAEEGTGDSVSDFDVDLFVAAPDAFVGEGWLQAIAPVLLASEDDEGPHPVHLVFFEGQQKVEFRIRPATEAEAAGTGAARVLHHRAPGGAAPDGADRGASGVPGADGPPAPARSDDAGRAPATGAAVPGALRAVPVLSAPDVDAWLAHWRAVGFATGPDDAGGGWATTGGVRLRVVADPADGPVARGRIDLEADDPGALGRAWAGVAGGSTAEVDGTWVHTDPAGNVVRLVPSSGA